MLPRPFLALSGDVLSRGMPVWQSAARIDQSWADPGRVWAEIDQIGQDWCGILTKRDPFWADFRRCQTDFDRCRRNLAQHRPNLGRCRLNQGQHRGMLGPTSTKLGPTSAKFRPPVAHRLVLLLEPLEIPEVLTLPATLWAIAAPTRECPPLHPAIPDSDGQPSLANELGRRPRSRH